MVDFGAIIGESAEWTKQVLFNPFNFKKWLVLTFIALMAGAMSNGCNFNSGGGGNGSHNYEHKQQQSGAINIPGSADKAEGYTAPSTAAAPASKPAARVSSPSAGNAMPEMAFVITFAIIAILVVFFVALVLLLVWLGARFSFVFLEDVVKNDISLGEPFMANGKEAGSYFRFSLALILATIVSIILIVLPAILILAKQGLLAVFDSRNPDPKAVFGLILVCIPFVLIFILLMVVLTIISVIAKDLVLPIMYKEKIKFLAGWGKAWALVKKNVGNFVVYLLIKLGLGIGAGIVYIIAFILGFIIAAIPVALVVFVLWLISRAMPSAAIFPYWLVIGLILLPICAFLFYCLMSLNLPFAVFFRTYSLKFLERLDPQYALIKTDKPLAPQQ